MQRADACVRQCRALALRQNCRACVEACPREAIELDPLSVKLDRCDGCRLCIEACPAGALEDARSGRRKLVAAWRRTRPGAPFVVACDSAGHTESDAPALRLTCLGGLGWEVAAIPLLLGASSVELRHRVCEQCRLGARARRVIDRVRNELGLLADALRLGHVLEAELPPQAPAAPRGSSRRALLSALLDRRSPEVNALLDVAIPNDRERAWLRALTARLVSVHPNLARARPVTGLGVRPVIDDARCTRCGVCRMLCPAGALAAPHARSSARHLVVFSHRCAGCERCVRACPERAVALEPSLDLRLWASGQSAQVVAERRAPCRACGGDGVLPGLELCGPCRRSPWLPSSSVALSPPRIRACARWSRS
jgi:Pyruvate/2-oxoacid:ferredoxin oxidoreductase delta subunit